MSPVHHYRQRALRILLLLLLAPVVCAHEGPLPLSLKGVPIPEVPGLYDGPTPIIVDRAKALALGKALFWDVNVGSDGMACASCHYHAGTDRRERNQVAPTGEGRALAAAGFETDAEGRPRRVNGRLSSADFPLVQGVEPLQDVAVFGLARASDDASSGDASHAPTLSQLARVFETTIGAAHGRVRRAMNRLSDRL